MSDLEHVIQSFKLSKAGGEIPAEYDPELWLKVYDKEEGFGDYPPAIITNITKCPDGCIAIEVKYTDDTTDSESSCYFIDEDIDADLPLNDGMEDCGVGTFDYFFMTEHRMNQLRDKIWPKIIKPDDVDNIQLEYIETLDLTHANYKFICWRENATCIITLSREDMKELFNDIGKFLLEILDVICITKFNNATDEEE